MFRGSGAQPNPQQYFWAAMTSKDGGKTWGAPVKIAPLGTALLTNPDIPQPTTADETVRAGTGGPRIDGNRPEVVELDSRQSHPYMQGARRRHYDQLNDWPDGVIVMGDAFCAFNPVYGQGIAVGACEATLVRDAINNEKTPDGVRHLLRQFGKQVALPWSIASATDLQYPTCQQNPTRLGALQDSWTRQLERLAVHGNERAAYARNSVYHLMAPPHRLLHPAFVWASITGSLRGYGPPNPRPAALPE